MKLACALLLITSCSSLVMKKGYPSDEDAGMYDWPTNAGKAECTELKGHKAFKHSETMTKSKTLAGITYIGYPGERTDGMQAMLEARADGVKFKRFPAVQKHQVTKADLKEFSTGKEEKYMDERGLGEQKKAIAAIWVAHAKAMKSIYAARTPDQDPDDMYLIMEDDVALANHKWKKQIMQAVEHTPDDWDILKVGYWGDRACGGKVNDFVFQANGPHDGVHYQGNGGYLVRLGQIPKILKNLQQRNIADLDRQLVTTSEDPDSLKVYAVRSPYKIVHNVWRGNSKRAM